MPLTKEYFIFVGSYTCRVGWAIHDEPSLIFKNVVAKSRKDRIKKDTIPVETPAVPSTQVGNDITNIEAVRFQLKTQFDRNIVTHFEAQEQILDYMFTKLGIDTDGCVQHPLVMSEALLNPNYCRQCKYYFRLAPKFCCRFYLRSTCECVESRFYPVRGGDPFSEMRDFLLKISMGIGKLANSKKLLFTVIFTETQHF